MGTGPGSRPPGWLEPKRFGGRGLAQEEAAQYVRPTRTRVGRERLQRDRGRVEGCLPRRGHDLEPGGGNVPGWLKAVTCVADDAELPEIQFGKLTPERTAPFQWDRSYQPPVDLERLPSWLRALAQDTDTLVLAVLLIGLLVLAAWLIVEMLLTRR
jgi:hypothetical protein